MVFGNLQSHEMVFTFVADYKNRKLLQITRDLIKILFQNLVVELGLDLAGFKTGKNL
jgi:hypothetical protein